METLSETFARKRLAELRNRRFVNPHYAPNACSMSAEEIYERDRAKSRQERRQVERRAQKSRGAD